MSDTSFYVNAIWDPEAQVWVSQTNIPGLVVEADCMEEFHVLVKALAPELISANVG